MALALARSKALGFELNENLRMEIVWCLTEIGKLEDLRNDAIHTPVYENHKGKIVAWFELGHPRAKGLANKDLLLEFAWFYDAAVVLRQYCGELSGFVGRSDGSAPTRPKLPNRASAALKVS